MWRGGGGGGGGVREREREIVSNVLCDCILVLCLVIGYVLQFGKIALTRVNCYFFFCFSFFSFFLVFSLWHIARENEKPQADSLERQQ